MKTIIKPGVEPARIDYEPVAGGLSVRRQSTLTGAVNQHIVAGLTEQMLKDWCDPVKLPLIQNVMPFLSAENREFLISGITPGEWQKYLEGYATPGAGTEREDGL